MPSDRQRRALAQLAPDYPLPKLLLEYRGIAKLKSTYTDKLPRMVNPGTGRVHTTYGQAVAITGASSTEPNLQNIPCSTTEGRRIREASIAAPWQPIVSAAIAPNRTPHQKGHISRDAGLLWAFVAGEDIHRATAAEIFSAELDSVGGRASGAMPR